MLTIILGLVFGIACFRFSYTCIMHFVTKTLILLLGLTIIILSLNYGFLGDSRHHNEWELYNETPLVTLYNSTASKGYGGLFYVSVSADNVYTYRYEIDSEFGSKKSKSYIVATLNSNDKLVIETEDPECTKPVLQHYIRTNKKSIWTFGLERNDIYDFHVPEGSIIKDVTLK